MVIFRCSAFAEGWSSRVVDLWNQLSHNVEEIESLDCFKLGLDMYMNGIGWL